MNQVQPLNVDSKSITADNGNYCVNGNKVVKAVLASKKGNGKIRARWKGKPWSVPLAVCHKGAVIKNDTVWFVLLEVADGSQYMLGLDDFLNIG